MAKYQDILERRNENARLKEKKQEQLRKGSGIRNTGYYLKEKTWKSYLKDGAAHIWYLAYAALAFIGAIMALNPESRRLLLQIFHLG
ncbi:hypothetical protein [Otoolea muris]|uniref:hypothetical protein n=1 Tax=Otoolea muris TaxID=2941515 RepID=UPI00203B111F|nr:hypothetical protein [Otoolea muris]